ncbi:hypothetical protein [Yokenella regensburgei]|uniref:hypothetical protein n=1 Tax=Yokenella regensburgei TaxID=158877 RepID=UPI003F5CED72
MLMENGENEISLEIGALGWFSDKSLATEERDHFEPQSACSLELVRFNGQEKQTLSSIKVTINTQGLPEAQPDSSRTITREKVLAEQTVHRQQGAGSRFKSYGLLTVRWRLLSIAGIEIA